MAAFRKHCSFHAINLTTVLKHDLPKCSEVLGKVMELVHEQVAMPIYPTTLLPFSKIEEGFRTMQMGKHVGKIVFEAQDDDLVPVSFPFHPVSSGHCSF